MPEKTDQIQHVDQRDTALAEQTRAGATFVPAVDIFETADKITLVADMPGVNAERLFVDLRDGVLTLRGQVADERPEGEVDVAHEFQSGTYVRQFTLSDVIDQDRIEATLVDGVLRLTLPKAERTKPRQIEVHAG